MLLYDIQRATPRQHDERYRDIFRISARQERSMSATKYSLNECHFFRYGHDFGRWRLIDDSARMKSIFDARSAFSPMNIIYCRKPAILALFLHASEMKA